MNLWIRGVHSITQSARFHEAHTLQDKKDLKVNLEQQARQCNWLVLWLDCDREGENIAYEVIACERGNKQSQTKCCIALTAEVLRMLAAL